MAKVVQINRLPVERPVASLTLELNAREAQLLTSVLRRVGGSPDGDRGFLDSVLIALRDTGLPMLEDLGSKAGSIYFNGPPLQEKKER